MGTLNIGPSKGFIINTPELAFSASGTAYIRLAIAHSFNKKVSESEWEKQDEIIVNATAFGSLAEYIAEQFDGGKCEIEWSGTLKEEEYEHNGETRKSNKGKIRTVSGPLPKRGGNSGGNGGGWDV
ncbi:single-stranded DNA-binding protein [Nocardia transvalensis]|uniref:single-stranded DNA-binding protein n=1 Tax=Nocardia transvalensis TaxID=37333 RepID=UPI001894D936|nr:single-stranded DNA-binding protein [Nocardia transvalensis]MBF6330843.1 single-stranded DNA-binding protein [Nocardia transvalensis]